jgi:hypothetical protein
MSYGVTYMADQYDIGESYAGSSNGKPTPNQAKRP